MPRGDKAKAEFLVELKKMAAANGGNIEAAIAEAEKLAVKKGVVKPTLDNNPEVKADAEKLLEWCRGVNRRIVINPDTGIKLSTVRKAKEE